MNNKIINIITIIIGILSLSLIAIGIFNFFSNNNLKQLTLNISTTLPDKKLSNRCTEEIYANCYSSQEFTSEIINKKIIINDIEYPIDIISETVGTINQGNISIVFLTNPEGVLRAENLNSILESSLQSNICVKGSYIYIYKVEESIYSPFYTYEPKKGYIQLSKCEVTPNITFHSHIF